jgi:hypothetical protein
VSYAFTLQLHSQARRAVSAWRLSGTKAAARRISASTASSDLSSSQVIQKRFQRVTVAGGISRQRLASRGRIRVFPANCRSACHIYLQDGVHQIPAADVSERSLEEFTLPRWNNIRNDDDQPGMEVFPAVERREISPIICDERVLLVTDFGHQLPILGAAQPEEVDVLTGVPGTVRHPDERRVKALVDQEPH